ncbi:hypothetical protein [Nocardia nova]|uniref:hypothetical protein n=1 Tax=Nocardia nova TaxID=37330 RepID=UPI0033ED7457
MRNTGHIQTTAAVIAGAAVIALGFGAGTAGADVTTPPPLESSGSAGSGTGSAGSDGNFSHKLLQLAALAGIDSPTLSSGSVGNGSYQ